MNAQEAYKTFNKIAKQFEEIRTIYSHLKSDIDAMSNPQIKSQVTKILNRISKVDITLIEECLEPLKKYMIYDDVKVVADKILSDIEEMKDFIYSIKGPQKEEMLDPEQEDQIDRSTPLDKKLDYIRDKYKFLQKQLDAADTTQIIRDARRLENILSRLNFEDLDEKDYQEIVDIKNEVSKMIVNLQGIEKSEKYGPYINAPLVDLITNHITLGNREIAENKAATILDFIEAPERIDMFEPAIKRIIARKMTPKEFKTFYNSIMSMISGSRKFESFREYTQKFNF